MVTAIQMWTFFDFLCIILQIRGFVCGNIDHSLHHFGPYQNNSAAYRPNLLLTTEETTL